MLALALAVTLQVLPATPGAADSAAVAPESQVLELELNPAATTWNGSLRANLTVRRATRRFALRLAGPDPSRVEMVNAAGPVPLVFGWHGRDTLLIETAAPMAPGPVALNLAFGGTFAGAGPGLWRPDEKHVVLENGAGLVVPQWPGGTPDTPWRLSVHAPAACDVVASLQRKTRSLQRDWGTWEFTSGRPFPADSLRVEVRPLVPHPARRRGAVHHRRPRRH